MVSIPSQHSAASASLHHQHQQPNGYYPAIPNAGSAAASQPPAAPSHASLYDVCYALNKKIDAFLAEEVDEPRLRDVQSRLRVSLDLVEQALKKYRLDQIAISWNGGKDCMLEPALIFPSGPQAANLICDRSCDARYLTRFHRPLLLPLRCILRCLTRQAPGRLHRLRAPFP